MVSSPEHGSDACHAERTVGGRATGQLPGSRRSAPGAMRLLPGGPRPAPAAAPPGSLAGPCEHVGMRHTLCRAGFTEYIGMADHKAGRINDTPCSWPEHGNVQPGTSSAPEHRRYAKPCQARARSCPAEGRGHYSWCRQHMESPVRQRPTWLTAPPAGPWSGCDSGLAAAPQARARRVAGAQMPGLSWQDPPPLHSLPAHAQISLCIMAAWDVWGLCSS